MFVIRAEGIDDLLDGMKGMEKQIPYAMASGLNTLAFGIREKEMETIRRVFPTARPQTAKNVFVHKATVSRQQAVVFFDQLYAKGLHEYMRPNVEGGRRGMKPSEQRLGRYYVPGIGAKLDAYGNMKGGYVTQILSRMGRFGDVAGYDMNQTAASKKRLSRMRGSGKRSTEYFMIQHQGGGLKPGIYQRTEKRHGFTSVGRARGRSGKVGAYQEGWDTWVRARGAVPVMLFVKGAPAYKPVWPFRAAGQQYLDDNYRKVMAAAIEAQIQRELAYRMRHGR